MMVYRILAILLCAALAGCAHDPLPTAYQHIDSGINAINGGGENSTGEMPRGNVRTVLIP